MADDYRESAASRAAGGLAAEKSPMHEFLTARIAELENGAAQFESLRELNRCFTDADDTQDMPPDVMRKFRENVAEHGKAAAARVAAVEALKLVRDADTVEEQISLLRRLTRELEKSAARNSLQSDEMDDGSPLKACIDEEAYIEMFAALALRNVLGRVDPEAASRSASGGPDNTGSERSRPTAPANPPTPRVASTPEIAAPHRTTGRLGQVLSWLANIAALCIFGIFIVVATSISNSNDRIATLGVGVAFAVAVWACGRGFRYILAGS
jgi:hypothetical protein